MSIISVYWYKKLFVCCMNKHFETMLPLPYIHPIKMNCRVINVSQLVRSDLKLASNEKNTASKLVCFR